MSFEEMSLALNSHLAEDDANELELFGVVDPGDKNDAIKVNKKRKRKQKENEKE